MILNRLAEKSGSSRLFTYVNEKNRGAPQSLVFPVKNSKQKPERNDSIHAKKHLKKNKHQYLTKLNSINKVSSDLNMILSYKIPVLHNKQTQR